MEDGTARRSRHISFAVTLLVRGVVGGGLAMMATALLLGDRQLALTAAVVGSACTVGVLLYFRRDVEPGLDGSVRFVGGYLMAAGVVTIRAALMRGYTSAHAGCSSALSVS